MTLNFNFPQRKTLRLKTYDYSGPGYYFVTICTKNREEYFGVVVNRKMFLNRYGETVKNCWLGISDHCCNVLLNEFNILPNHIHGIIIIQNVGNRHACSLQNNNVKRHHQTLFKIIGSFKSAVSKLIHEMGPNSFRWQKSYHEHIIRNEKSLEKIRQYIRYNHLKWDEDIENPKNRWRQDYYEKLFE
jgi:REP element-mobilizing transposase RayT